MNLQGKVAVITGSSAGVGRAAALAFAEKGCTVVINYSQSRSEGEEAAELCRARGVAAIAVQADVSIDAECRRLIQAAVDGYPAVSSSSTVRSALSRGRLRKGRAKSFYRCRFHQTPKAWGALYLLLPQERRHPRALPHKSRPLPVDG